MFARSFLMRALSKLRLHLLRGALKAIGIRRRRILAWRSMLEAGVEFVSCEREEIIWSLPLREDCIAFQVFVDGGFQTREISALLDWMSYWGVLSGARDVVLDVGANIGSTCVPLVREMGCRGLAIEPIGESFRFLKMNVEANGLGDRIRLARKAVLRSPGKVKMCLMRGAPGGDFVCRDDSDKTDPDGIAGYEDAEADGLMAILQAAGLSPDEVGLVWADVQGCEADVIESGARLWESGVPLWAEVEPRSLMRQGTLETFASVAAMHFDRFIDSRDLLRLGKQAPTTPIEDLGRLIHQITPEQLNTDVLFLPPRFVR